MYDQYYIYYYDQSGCTCTHAQILPALVSRYRFLACPKDLHHQHPSVHSQRKLWVRTRSELFIDLNFSLWTATVPCPSRYLRIVCYQEKPTWSHWLARPRPCTRNGFSLSWQHRQKPRWRCREVQSCHVACMVKDRKRYQELTCGCADEDGWRCYCK